MYTMSPAFRQLFPHLTQDLSDAPPLQPEGSVISLYLAPHAVEHDPEDNQVAHL